MRITPVNAGNNVQLWAKDIAGNWYDINVVGWGPAEGFALPAQYDVIKPVYLLSDQAGTYTLEVKLVDLNDNNTVITSESAQVTVEWIVSQTYTVTFDSQGDSAVDSISNVVSGDKITAPAAPTRSGFSFGGWYKEADCTNAWDFVNDVVTDDITLYAKWTANPTYTVTFNSQEGSAVDSISNVVSGSNLTAPAAPTRSGFSFGGWYKEAECTNAWDFANDVVTGDITLYAKWTAVSTGGQLFWRLLPCSCNQCAGNR